VVSPLNHLNLGLCVEGRGFDKGKALPLTVVSARSREGAVAQTSPYISKEYVSITKDRRRAQPSSCDAQLVDARWRSFS